MTRDHLRPVRGLSRFVIAGLVLLLTASLQLTGAPPAAAAVQTGPVFNNPDGTVEEQQAIRTRILGLIEGTAPGSAIKVSVYHFWDIEVARALLAAHTERQVDVQVIVDSTSISDQPSSTTYSTLAAALGEDRTQPSFAGTCPVGRSCLGDPARGTSINHNKFWLFSETGGSQNVVVQTSSNFSSGNWNKLHNDAFVLSNASVHASYSTYFDKLAAMDWASWQYTAWPDSGAYKPYFFPRADGGDTVLNILNNVTSCSYTDADGILRRTQIRVGMFLFTRQALADKLAALRDQGCGVRIVYSESDMGVWNALHYSGGPEITCQNWEDDENTANSRRAIHSKFLAISGSYVNRAEKVVWTGSHNYSAPALNKHDEALLKIADDSVYEAYDQRFQQVWDVAVPGTADATSYCQGIKDTEEF